MGYHLSSFTLQLELHLLSCVLVYTDPQICVCLTPSVWDTKIIKYPLTLISYCMALSSLFCISTPYLNLRLYLTDLILLFISNLNIYFLYFLNKLPLLQLITFLYAKSSLYPAIFHITIFPTTFSFPNRQTRHHYQYSVTVWVNLQSTCH
jgi:hypothetical protein